GGSMVCIHVYHVEAYHYWHNSQGYLDMYDMITGLIKPTFFGATIAIVSCHRGLNADAGAEGVGRAATRAFVASFIVILILDFFLVFFFNTLRLFVWPVPKPAGFT